MNPFQVTQAESNAITLRNQLRELDQQRVRPLADVAIGNGDVKDLHGKTPTQRLKDIEAQAQILREQLAIQEVAISV
jgi:hypothetical protein